MASDFSLKEAAAIVEVPEPVVRKAVEAKTVRPRRVLTRSGRAPRYRFGVKDMLFLKLMADFPLALSRQDKTALRDLIEKRRREAGRWQVAGSDFALQSGDITLVLRVKHARNALAHNLLAFRRGRRRIVSDPTVVGGEPVFEGTRIPLAHIAALIAKHVPLEEIAEDYPALSRDDLAFAAIHARMKPNPGRPRKPVRFIRPSDRGAKEPARARHSEQ